MSAPAPTRTTIKGQVLSIGLVSIALDLYKTTQDSANRRSMYTADHRPIAQILAVRDSDPLEIVQRGDTVKCMRLEDDVLVEISDEEMAAVADPQPNRLDLIGFAPLSQVGVRYLPETWYQARPGSVGSGKNKSQPYDKVFTLLLTTLAERNLFALVTVTVREKVRYGALMPTGRLAMLHYDDEVREELPLPEADVTEAEVKMMGTLIDSLLVDEAPEMADVASRRQLEYAQAKALDGKVTPIRPEPVQAEAPDDLMAALMASIQAQEAVA